VVPNDKKMIGKRFRKVNGFSEKYLDTFKGGPKMSVLKRLSMDSGVVEHVESI